MRGIGISILIFILTLLMLIFGFKWECQADTCPICLCSPERYAECAIEDVKKTCTFPDRKGMRLKDGKGTRIRLQKGSYTGISPLADIVYVDKHQRQHRYKIQKYMAREKGQKIPLTNLMALNANDLCRDTVSEKSQNLYLVHLYAFEWALRHNKIMGDRSVLYELVRIPQSKLEREMVLIRDEDKPYFPFELGDRRILLFNWRTGKYSEHADVYSRHNIGFRCMAER